MSRDVDATCGVVVVGARVSDVGVCLAVVVLGLVARPEPFELLVQAASASTAPITVATKSADGRVIDGSDRAAAAPMRAVLELSGEQARASIVASPPVG
jgi:hypothetical protein